MNLNFSPCRRQEIPEMRDAPWRMHEVLTNAKIGRKTSPIQNSAFLTRSMLLFFQSFAQSMV